jgi:hypothetical protein
MDQLARPKPKRQSSAEGKHHCPGRFLKGDYSTRTNQANNRAQNRNRIGKKHQDETTDSRIERFVADNLVHISLREAHVMESGLSYARPCSLNRARIALDPYDLP